MSHDMVCGTVVIHRKALPELLHTIIRREASAVASLPLGFSYSLLIELFITRSQSCIVNTNSSFVPRPLLPSRKTGREPGRSDHMPRDVLCIWFVCVCTF